MLKLYNKLHMILLLAMMALPGLLQAQEDFSGTYYLAMTGKGSYTSGSTDNFYLCPTEGWAFYVAGNCVQGGDNGQPFLTTYKCKDGVYDLTEAKWIIQKHDTENYYYIIQATTNRYLTYNGQLCGAGANRARVHLESRSDGDNILFSISWNGSYYFISSKTDKSNYLNVTEGNFNSLEGESTSKNDGPTGYKKVGGIIGRWTEANNTSQFIFEDYITRPTIAYDENSLIKITSEYHGATIRYTTDGTPPSALNGTTYSAPFDPDENVTVIKAVAIVGSEVSNVATFTIVVPLGSNHPRLIQSQANPWNTDDFHFYMIPGNVESGVTKVNTTSLFRPTMEWYFLNAGVEDKIQYYYIVNPATNKRLCYDGTNKVYMEGFTSGDKFKFRIVESPTAGTYNIIPKGQSSVLQKGTDNANVAVVALDSHNNYANSRWKIVLPSALDKTAPFTVSDPDPHTRSYTYYKMASVNNAAYFILGSDPSVTVSNSTDATVVRKMHWYLEQAQAESSEDWLTYYYIRNAVTGKYLYCTKDAISNQASFALSDEVASGSDRDRYLFTWARTAPNSQNAMGYYIVPKNLKDISQNAISTLNKYNNTVLSTVSVRISGNAAWNFSSSSYSCATPTITYDATEGGYVITATESDATIEYRVLDASDNVLIGETVYDPENDPAIRVEDWTFASPVYLTAIVHRNADYGDISSEASQTVEKVETPSFTVNTDGTVTLTCATDGASIYYAIVNSSTDPTVPTTLYEDPIDNAVGKYIKAIAKKDGWMKSEIAISDLIKFKCATPVITLSGSNSITIACSFPTSGVKIYYEKEETPNDPTTSSTPYEGPITFLNSEIPFTIKAIAVATNYENSDIATFVVNLEPPKFYYLQNQQNTAYYMCPSSTLHPTNHYPLVQTDQSREMTAVWRLQKVPGGSNEYQIIHHSDGKYLVADKTALEQSVWLTPDNPNDGTELFVVNQVSSGVYTIMPKGANNAEGKNYLNVTGGNGSNHTIGLWTATDGSKWKFTKVPAPPTITVDDIEVTMSRVFSPNSKIYYTTDNQNPTTGSSEYSSKITLEYGPSIPVKAICWYHDDTANDNWESDVASKTVQVPLANPILTRSGNTVTISSPQHTSHPDKVAFWYTHETHSSRTDPVPNGAGQQYTSPIALTANSLNIIKAIAYNPSAVTYTSEVVTLVVDLRSATTISSFAGITDPYGNYKFASNFTPTGTPSNNIGSQANPFRGTLDGNMVEFSLTTNPLFSYIEDATIKNMNITSVGISTTGDAGAIANVARGDSRIYNCGIKGGTVSGSGKVGGIVGLLDGSSRVINCFSYANVSGGSYVGGIVGYNNVATTAINLKTMVMNCMFYGEVSGSSVAPIYNGQMISNVGDKGVSNFNYFRLESAYIQDNSITKVYNCALGAEDRFLQRFEFYRHLLNSHRELAGWWATGVYSSSEMMKWVLEPSQIGTSTPYPILKPQGKYPSVVNIDADNAADFDNPTTHEPRNKGRKFGTLTVNIQKGSGGAQFAPPTGAVINTSTLTLNITDKDPDHFNFNYYKVQLPYYNDVGTKNYTGNRVVTGWKIVGITGGTAGSYSTGEDVTYTGGVLTATPYNFADRNCTDKDLYSVSGRVFNQGAYWDVPYGVTAITIEPYWAKCVYLADAYPDKVYNQAMTTVYDVPNVGGGRIYDNRGSYPIAGEEQMVFTAKGDAIATSNSGLFQGASSSGSHTVYDYAVVLVGNYHFYGDLDADMSKPYTVTSIDLDGDNEPDYSYILRFDSRKKLHPVRVDFINIPGLGMAQKSTGGTGTYNFGIMQPKGWFESTNTSLFRETQFEYDNSERVAAPYILQGGVMEQWVNGQSAGHANLTTYFHVGGNVWFKEFHRGTHQDQQYDANHSPVSVTGGDFDQFHLTGLYRADVDIRDDNAECYITGGRFGVVAGTGMDGIGDPTNHTNGNITWIIDNADIKEFYAGSFNADKPAQGNLHTIVNGGYIDFFCGGPKFGDMNSGRTVTTTATGCTFGTFFGAGYGGSSYSRQAPFNHSSIVNFPHNQTQAGNDASWNAWLARFYKQEYNSTYGGVSTQFNYQFLPMSGNADNVARIFVEYVKFSLATTYSVTSTLKNCTVDGNFYGGGSLGKVEGDVTSTLESCTVQGNVFGAGYSASLPPVEVDSLSFRVEPYYYTELGTYRTGVKGKTTTYTWRDTTATVNSTATAINKTKKFLYTNEDLKTLGTVTGNATLTLKGTTTVGTLDGEGTLVDGTGNVFGGGDESAVNNDTNPANANTTVILQGKAEVYGNVYGGGNRGHVSGNSQVKIQD